MGRKKVLCQVKRKQMNPSALLQKRKQMDPSEEVRHTGECHVRLLRRPTYTVGSPCFDLNANRLFVRCTTSQRALEEWHGS